LAAPCRGHKGKTAFRATCHGRAAHSANPALGVNAIHMAADFIGRIRERQADIAQSGARDPAYEVPYTTLHVGVIQGGTVLNIVPSRCELEFEFRTSRMTTLPGSRPRCAPTPPPLLSAAEPPSTWTSTTNTRHSTRRRTPRSSSWPAS